MRSFLIIKIRVKFSALVHQILFLSLFLRNNTVDWGLILKCKHNINTSALISEQCIIGLGSDGPTMFKVKVNEHYS